MTSLQVPYLMYTVLGGDHSGWRWVVKDDGARFVWSLVQTTKAGLEYPSGIYACGPHLPLVAKVFAGVTPVALAEMSECAAKATEALEQLARLQHVLQRMRARAYRWRRTDEYEDLHSALALMTVTRVLLEASRMPALDELRLLELEAMKALRGGAPR